MAYSSKPVGRANYVLRVLLVTAMAFAIGFLANGFLHLAQLPRYGYASQRVVLFGLVGSFLFPVLDGRLIDAGFSRAYRYPGFGLWLIATSLSSLWPKAWPLGLGLLLLLLAVGGAMPSRALPSAHAATDRSRVVADRIFRRPHVDEARPGYPPRLLVSPLGFLRSLVTLGCLWLPLIWLEGAFGQGAWIWFPRLGYFLLTFVWLYIVLGRLADAERLPGARYGYLIIGIILLMGALLHFGMIGKFSPLHGFETAGADRVWMRWLEFVNGYEWLGLFLATQIPLALLPSRLGGPKRDAGSTSSGRGKRKSERAETSDLSISGPLEYLRILAVIACLWLPLIYVDRASSGGAGSWIARAGYVVLGCFWLIFANGRLEDAGWTHDMYPSQYFLIVSVASLMPLAFHWVNGYGAVIIFLVVQIPTVALRSKLKPDDLTPDSV